MSVLVTVAICSNRESQQLQKAILSLIHQSSPAEEYEILIVDNYPVARLKNLADATKSEFRSTQIQYIHESKTGLSYARNAAAKAARGEWVIYMDDDACAHPDFLCAIHKAILAYPDAAAIAGKVVADWEETPPEWWKSLQSIFDMSVSVVERGDQPRPIQMPEWMCGAAYAVRRDILLNLGGHDQNLGRKGTLQLGNEEVDLQMRLEQAGMSIIYYPDAIVHHHIPKTRLTKKRYLLQQYWEGRSQYLVDRKFPKRDQLFKQVIYLVCRTPWSLILALIFTIRGLQGFSIYRLGQEFYGYGYIQQLIMGKNIPTDY